MVPSKNNNNNSDTYYNSLFGNILVIGKSNSGKTSLIQAWALNGCFPSVIKVFWVSGLQLEPENKYKINACFEQEVVFVQVQTPQDIEQAIIQIKADVLGSNTDTDNSDSDIDTDNSDADSSDDSDNVITLGEKSRNKYLVIFDVSEIADRSVGYIQFLTTGRKAGFSTISIFHLAYSTKNNWQMIKSQADIFVLCNSGEASPSVDKILINNSMRNDGGKHIPGRSLWLKKLYADIIGYNSKSHLMIDKRDNMRTGPARFRSNTEKESQLCYYADPLNNTQYLVFHSKRINNHSPALYKIYSLRTTGLNGHSKEIPAGPELEKLSSSNIFGDFEQEEEVEEKQNGGSNGRDGTRQINGTDGQQRPSGILESGTVGSKKRGRRKAFIHRCVPAYLRTCNSRGGRKRNSMGGGRRECYDRGRELYSDED